MSVMQQDGVISEYLSRMP